MFVGWVVIISVISTLVMVLTLNATMLPLNVLQDGVSERNSALFQWMIAAAWVPAALACRDCRSFCQRELSISQLA